ncbi:hypothetical protein ACFVAJ_18290 [Agromyces sp. NPDC057679]|uniref:hypothetical protein n=1 Tax=Agromyces sp. NPDC057679 TaxID=3346207 RepID=UPI00366B0414
MRTPIPSLQRSRPDRPSVTDALLTPTTGPIAKMQAAAVEQEQTAGMVEIPSNQLTDEHVGDDITFSVGGVLTGGKLEALDTAVFGILTAIKVDGVAFLLDESVNVQVRETNLREKILTVADPARRSQLIHAMFSKSED